MLNVELDERGNIRLVGKFDASQVDQASEVFDQVEGDCVVDCTELDYISSAGIGVLITAYKRLTSINKQLKLVNLKQNVQQILHYAGIIQVLAAE